MLPNFFKTKDLFQYELTKEDKKPILDKVVKLEKKEPPSPYAIPGPAVADIKSTELGGQALKEWNRNAEIYYINGKSVDAILLELKMNDPAKFKEIAKEGPHEMNPEKIVRRFKDVTALGLFINEYLLCKVEDFSVRDRMLHLALNHFHQSGLPHALNTVIYAKAAQIGGESGVYLQQPTNIEIHFTPLKDGIQIKEKNKYQCALNAYAKDADKSKETVTDHLKGLWERYFVKAECVTSLTAAKGLDKRIHEKVTLHHLFIKIPDPRFHKMLEKMSVLEWLKEKISSLFNKKSVTFDAKQEQRISRGS